MRWWFIPLIGWLAGCAAPLHTSQIPQIGWTRHQVNLALQESWQVSRSASGYETRQYGILRNAGTLQHACNQYSSACMYVTLKGDSVIEVTLHDRY